jgi:gliding motility-associated-like protein
MIKRNSILFLLCVICSAVSATHNRAGEITYRHISGYTFEFTVTTYTYMYSAANRSSLNVSWGDGSGVSSLDLVIPPGHYHIPNTDYYHNTYIGTHTFPGTGVYEILMEDPNRNLGVKNIPNSVNTIFSIKTIMLVGSSVGANNTPVLLNPPIDKAARGHIFIHNPSAYDPDGDSISYTITTCLGMGGEPIEGYSLPPASDTLLINEISGDLIWNTPTEIGVYNIAILVEEWRKKVRIGRIERDMQVNVYESDNHPPVNPEISDFCIVAGDSVFFSVTSTDADGDSVVQTMNGGPFEVDNSAKFKLDSAGRGYATSSFKWVTNCKNARQQPYYVVLKSEDRNDDIQEVDITSFSIKVLHPPVENLVATPGYDTIRLDWDIPTCILPAGYRIYRSNKPYGYIPDSCETGVPGYTGFALIDVITGSNTNSYKDDNHGEGLVPGYDYCYMISAFYNDGAESLASTEVCTTLVAGTPPILKVSVAIDSITNGAIDIVWAMPRGIDTISDGPYSYEILRKSPGETEFTSIKTIPTIDLTDTTFTNSGINTMIHPYTYSVILSYEKDGDWFKFPGNEYASSQYIDIIASDNELTLNMKKRTPWLNTRYDVYRRQGETDPFVYVGYTTESIYHDTLLINNNKYTYRSIGFGRRPLYDKDYLIENISHIASDTPIDTVPPCPPELIVTSNCDNDGVVDSLTWSTPDSCMMEEIVAYKVYFRNTLDGPFTLIDSLSSDIFIYVHRPDSVIEGYYTVTAIDSSNNESAKNPIYFINICGYYRLPNVFTPNNDRINDIYTSFNLNHYVKKVDMTIYNRYGNVVYKTNDPDINWDGRNMDNKKLVSTGVYYYICDVYEPHISGPVVRNLTGFIHVYSGDENVKVE